MVNDLFDTYGAGQDETVFKFASDVNVDQTTEIARMQTHARRRDRSHAVREFPPEDFDHDLHAPPSAFLACDDLPASCRPAVSRSRVSDRSDGECRSRVRAPTPDPRVGLRAGLMDAAEAAWNLKLALQHAAIGRSSSASTNSDLAFTGNYAIQGNYNGYQVWDISQPERSRR